MTDAFARYIGAIACLWMIGLCLYLAIINYILPIFRAMARIFFKFQPTGVDHGEK